MRAGSERISDAAIEKALDTCGLLLLPSDHQYKADQLLTLFLRPSRRLKHLNTMKTISTGIDKGEVGYNYSNAADMENYVAAQDYGGLYNACSRCV